MFDGAFRRRHNWPLTPLRSTEEGSPVGGVPTGNDDSTRCEGFVHAIYMMDGERPCSRTTLPAAMATASTGLPEPMSAKSRFSDGNQLPSLAVRCSGERGRKQGVKE